MYNKCGRTKSLMLFTIFEVNEIYGTFDVNLLIINALFPNRNSELKWGVIFKSISPLISAL